jgi:hypothetical protein
MIKTIRATFCGWTGPSGIHIRNEDGLVYDKAGDTFSVESAVVEPIITSESGKGLLKTAKIVDVPITAAFKDGLYFVVTHDLSSEAQQVMDVAQVVVQGGRVVDHLAHPRGGFVV